MREALIRNAGWQPETSASAAEFLARPRVPGPNCLVLDIDLSDQDSRDHGHVARRIQAKRAESEDDPATCRRPAVLPVRPP